MAGVTVWLFIESAQITVESMCQAIGVLCDRSWNKGDPRGRTGKVFTTNAWSLGSTVTVDERPDEVLRQVKESLNDVLTRMVGHELLFRAAAAQGISGLLLGITAESAPAIVLDAAVLAGIASLGVDLEIDLIVG